MFTYDGLTEMVLVVEGQGVHCVDGQTIPCKANDIYIIPPRLPHRFFLNEQSDCLIVRRLMFRLEDWFRGEVATASHRRYCFGVFGDGAAVAYAMLNAQTYERIATLLDEIATELEDEENEWRSVVESCLTQLFTHVGRYINRSVKNAPVKQKDAEAICAAIKIVESEYSNCDLSLEMIAKRIFVSTSYLCRTFKAHTGQLFSEYLREIRLRRAAMLLEESGVTVESIIADCGFRDASAFYRNFRAHFGMTPQIYRQVTRSVEKTSEVTKQESEDTKRMQILNEISVNLQGGRAKLVKELVQKALDRGISAADILQNGLLAGMGVIGEKFKNNEVYVPEVLVAARAMNMGAQILKPHLAEAGVEAAGKVCIGTVQGDLHDIGKNLVKMMMEGKGLEVIDLGTDVAADTFVQTAIAQNCRVICCSSLLTTTMKVMEEVVKAAEAAGIRDKVKIMIGGAPVSEEFCRKIGADCYTPDAASAADAAVAFCRG